RAAALHRHRDAVSRSVPAASATGSEGEGVADTLFGLQPFTGRLPVTWFKAESQIPINVGDKNYDPLFPYGWGPQAGSPNGNAQAASGTAAQALRSALAAANWSGASVQRPDAVLADVQQAAAPTSSQTSWAERDQVVSIARDVAEQAITTPARMSATAALTANAEHALVAGNTQQAVQLLAQARSLALMILG